MRKSMSDRKKRRDKQRKKRPGRRFEIVVFGRWRERSGQAERGAQSVHNTSKQRLWIAISRPGYGTHAAGLVRGSP